MHSTQPPKPEQKKLWEKPILTTIVKGVTKGGNGVASETVYSKAGS